jgi:ATP-dependent Clp protease adaptor protein ClpS
MFMVVIHNDDHTTMEFVVRVLITVFRKKPEDAAALMMEVHGKGRGVAGVYTCDIAESLAEKALGEARGAGYPLVITVEEDGGG